MTTTTTDQRRRRHQQVGPSRVVFHLTPQLFRQGNLDGFGKLVARAQVGDMG